MHTNSLAVEVAARVRAVIAAQGLTRAEVSESLGISKYALTQRLTGKVGFTLSDLDRFASLTGYKADDFLADTFAIIPICRAA